MNGPEVNPSPAPVCRHCEERPRATRLGLCAACHARRGIRQLYLPRRGARPLTAADEQILALLKRRAAAGLPLFPYERPWE